MAGRGGQDFAGELLGPSAGNGTLRHVLISAQQRVARGAGPAAALQCGVLPVAGAALGTGDCPRVDLAGEADGGAVVAELGGAASALTLKDYRVRHAVAVREV